MPWWRRPVLFSVALQLSVKFCTVKVECWNQGREVLFATITCLCSCVCLLVRVGLCMDRYIRLYIYGCVGTCVSYASFASVCGGTFVVWGFFHWWLVGFVFFFFSLSHAFNSSKFLEQPACQGKAKYKSESWHHSCIWVLIPRRKSFPVGLAQYRRAPGLPGFANPGESAPAMWRKPLKSKLRVSFFG